MDITRIVYSRTFPIAQYESERIEMEASLDVEEETTPEEALMKIRTIVAAHSTKRLKAKHNEEETKKRRGR